MGLTCDCEDDLVGVDSEACDQVDYGSQIVKIFLQHGEGEMFDGTVGNAVAIAADWATKIAATGVDKIVTIPNITGTAPSQEPTIEEGQEVPYGGIEAIDNKFLVEAMIRYVKETTLSQVEKLTFCTGGLNLGYLTNTGWLFGGDVQADATLGKFYTDVKFIASTFGINGIGTKSKIPFKLQRVGQCMPKPIGNFPFLKTI